MKLIFISTMLLKAWTDSHDTKQGSVILRPISKRTDILMEWSWTVFLISWPIAFVVVQFTSGMQSASNAQHFGDVANAHKHPVAALTGHVIAGAIWASLVTIVAGSF